MKEGKCLLYVKKYYCIYPRLFILLLLACFFSIAFLSDVKASSSNSSKHVANEQLDSSSFPSTKITKINVGRGVTDIADNTFSKLYKLKSITVSVNNSYYSSYDGCLYNKDGSVLLCHPQAAVYVDYPESMVEIKDGALAGVDKKECERARQALKNNQSKKHDIEEVSTQIPDTLLGQRVREIISMCSSKGDSKEDILWNCYNYIITNGEYVRSAVTPVDDWVRNYGYEFLMTGQGNCYGYAAALAYLAKGIGYECRVATGQLGSAKGGLTPHSWCEIKMNDNWYLFDAEMQDAKGKDYYMKTYANYPSVDLYKDKEWFVNW